MRDTGPEAEAVYVEAVRRMTPAEKLRRISELTCGAWALSLDQLHRDFPGASDEECRRRLAVRTLGPLLARQVYGPDAPEEGS
jgi:hypothetical protein